MYGDAASSRQRRDTNFVVHGRAGVKCTMLQVGHEKSDLAHRVAVLERKRQISVETEARLSEAIKGFQAREEVLRQEVLQQHELTQEKNHEQSWETKQLAIVMQNLEALEAKNQMLDPSVECTGSAADKSCLFFMPKPLETTNSITKIQIL